MTAEAPPAAASVNLARSVALSTSTQLLARGVDLCVNVVVALVIIRHLGPRGYGDFVVVVTVAGLSGLFADLGLPKLAVRELVRDSTITDRLVGSVTVVRAVLAGVAALAAQLALFALDATAEIRVATAVAGTIALAEALLSVVVIFHAAVRQHFEALARLAANVVKLAAVTLLVLADAGLVALVGATTTTLLVAAAIGWIQARRWFGFRPAWDWQLVRGLLAEVAAVGPALVIGVLYLKVGAVLVALLGSRTDVGVFGAAYQPVEYLFLGSAVVVQVLYTVLARWEPGSAHFADTYRRGTEVLLVLVVPVGLAVAVTAPTLTGVAYDDSFAGSSLPLSLLSLALVGMTVNVWQGMVLLAANHARANLRCLVAALATNVALGSILIPRLGPAGAAWAVLASTVVLVGRSTRAVTTFTAARLDGRRISRLGTAAATMLTAMAAARLAGGHPALPVLLGALVYGALILRSGLLPVEDLRAAVRRSEPPRTTPTTLPIGGAP
ncbi:MAG: oligosaccharide flippase family protein [Acidimicrobiia bacterium]